MCEIFPKENWSQRIVLFIIIFKFFKDFRRKVKEILWWIACKTSSPGRSGGGVGKGRRASTTSLEFEYLLRKSRCEILIGGDDISNDVIFQCTCFSMFVYIRARFRYALIGGNLAVQVPGSLGELDVEFKFQRDVVASSPSFSLPASRAPRKACSQAVVEYKRHILFGHSLISLKLWKFVDSSPLNSNHKFRIRKQGWATRVTGYIFPFFPARVFKSLNPSTLIFMRVKNDHRSKFSN